MSCIGKARDDGVICLIEYSMGEDDSEDGVKSCRWVSCNDGGKDGRIECSDQGPLRIALVHDTRDSDCCGVLLTFMTAA